MRSRSSRQSRHVGRLVATLIVGLVAFAATASAVPPAAGAAPYRDCSDIALEPGAAMDRCDLADATIIGLDLHGISLSRADLSRVNAGCDPDEPRTNLAGASLDRAVLVDALLCDAILTDADLHRSNLSGAALEDATLTRANLARATLDGAAAHFATFADATLEDASWRDGAATATSFDGAHMRRIDLRGTNVSSSTFLDADLRFARLAGVDFSGADLTGADWRKATGVAAAIYADTTCPDGTNSDTNGGTCAGH